MVQVLGASPKNMKPKSQLNGGNGVQYHCKHCSRNFVLKTPKAKVTCMQCNKTATLVKVASGVGKKKIETKGTRAAKKADAIATSVEKTDQEAKGIADAVKEVEKVAREDASDRANNPDDSPVGEADAPDSAPNPTEETLPETAFQMPKVLYLPRFFKPTGLQLWLNRAADLVLPVSITVVLLTIWSLLFMTQLIEGLDFLRFPTYCAHVCSILVLLFTLVGRYLYVRETFIRFSFIRMEDVKRMPDMRPDSMKHTSLGHEGRRALYASDLVAARDPDARAINLDAYPNLVVDAELFSQIAPTVRMDPNSHAVSRIDNSTFRLSSVNYDRHDSEPIMDQTRTLLKAYHWTITEEKKILGYFSPYELTAPARQ